MYNRDDWGVDMRSLADTMEASLLAFITESRISVIERGKT
jgi:hypothetical protein